MSAASVRFACDTLAAAAPLVFQLQSVALEWSLLRKGKQLTPAQALVKAASVAFDQPEDK